MRTTIVAAVILMMTMMPVPAAKVEAPEVNLGALAYVDGWVDDIADTVLYCLSEAAPSWEVDAEGISFDFEQEAPRQLMVIARTGDQVFEKRVIVHNLCANGVPSVEDLDLPRPGYPGLPDAPEVPEAPGAPELPEVPEIPDAPELPLPGSETLAQLIGLVQGVVSEVKCDAGRTGLYLPGGVATIDDLCRSLNSQSGTCEENGDCLCGSQPQQQPSVTNPNPPADLDEDGVPDDEDSDDDCDYLADALERAMGFAPAAAVEDVMDMNPFSSIAPRLYAAIQGMNGIPDLDPGKDGHADIYIDLARFGYSSPYSADFVPAFPGLTRDNPKLDVGASFSLPDNDLGALGNWPSTFVNLGTIPESFMDPAYAWRAGAAGSGTPQIGIELKVMDKDGQTGDGRVATVSTSEGIGLLSVAGLVGQSLQPGIEHINGGGLTVAVKLGATLSPCAVMWADLIANGAYVVNLGESGIGYSRDEC